MFVALRVPVIDVSNHAAEVVNIIDEIARTTGSAAPLALDRAFAAIIGHVPTALRMRLRVVVERMFIAAPIRYCAPRRAAGTLALRAYRDRVSRRHRNRRSACAAPSARPAPARTNPPRRHGPTGPLRPRRRRAQRAHQRSSTGYANARHLPTAAAPSLPCRSLRNTVPARRSKR